MGMFGKQKLAFNDYACLEEYSKKKYDKQKKVLFKRYCIT
jgi:hypothetical protein